MSAMVESIRRRRIRSLDKQLHHFLRDRNVTQIEVESGLSCDGMIEPLGSTFGNGFRIRLKKGMPDARLRFTLAHEACHTFFYQLVPEIKFLSHSQDAEEERLCNFGAAALLVPASSLLQKAKNLPVCLESLELLASQYGASLPTMTLRLQDLGCWKVELSLWHRMVDGRFALDRLYSRKRLGWQWEDDSVLMTAWQSKQPLFGHTFVHYEDIRGCMRYKPISYEVRRSADGVVALWGSGIRKPSGRPLPLFHGARGLPAGAGLPLTEIVVGSERLSSASLLRRPQDPYDDHPR